MATPPYPNAACHVRSCFVAYPCASTTITQGLAFARRSKSLPDPLGHRHAAGPGDGEPQCGADDSWRFHGGAWHFHSAPEHEFAARITELESTFQGSTKLITGPQTVRVVIASDPSLFTALPSG